MNGVEVYRIPYSNLYWFGDLNKRKSVIEKVAWRIKDINNYQQYKILKELLISLKPDILHSQNLPGISLAAWNVAHDLEIPIVHTLRDFSLLDPVSIKFYSKMYTKITTRHSEKVNTVIGITKDVLKKHLDQGLFSNAKTFVVPNAIQSIYNSALYEFDDTTMNKNGALHLGYFGQLKSIKGVGNLITAVKELDENIVEKLSVFGEGPEQDLFMDLAGRDTRIEFFGKIPKELVSEKMKEMDLIVVPSVWDEPFGRVIIEAYQVRTPVIASNIGGIPEVIYNPKEDLFDINSVDGIKEKIIKYNRKNINERKELSSEVYKHSKEFSTDKLCLRHKDIYNMVLNTKVGGN